MNVIIYPCLNVFSFQDESADASQRALAKQIYLKELRKFNMGN